MAFTTGNRRVTNAELPAWLSARRMLRPAMCWSDVAGAPGPRAAARQLLWRLRRPELGLPPRAALISGPAGCGKTHLARAMCADLLDTDEGWDIFEISAAELNAERLGELSEVRSDGARRLVICDEVDLWAVHRDALSHTPATRSTLLALLSLLDGLVATSDLYWLLLSSRDPDELDPALVRPGRAGLTIMLPYPDLAARTDLFSYALRGVPLAIGAEPERAAIIVGERCTPAQIVRYAADAVALTRAAGAAQLGWGHLHGAIAADEPVADESTIARTALHEAGHAVIAYRLGLELRNVVIEPGRGVTELVPRLPGVPPTDAEAQIRITVALAGTVAERALGIDISLGAADDHERATEWALSRLRSGLDRSLPVAALARFERSPAAADAVHAAVSYQLRRGRAEAEWLVRRERRSIRHFAQVLAAERQLSGELLKQALQPPASPARRWPWRLLHRDLSAR